MRSGRRNREDAASQTPSTGGELQDRWCERPHPPRSRLLPKPSLRGIPGQGGHCSCPCSEARATDRQTDRRHQRVPDCGQRQGKARLHSGAGASAAAAAVVAVSAVALVAPAVARWVALAHHPLRGRGCPRILGTAGCPCWSLAGPLNSPTPAQGARLVPVVTSSSPGLASPSPGLGSPKLPGVSEKGQIFFFLFN